jgi:hypothetical protein
MSPKQKKTITAVTVCLVISVVAIAVMTVSIILDISRNGWETSNVIYYVPFIGIAVAFIAIYASKQKKK